MVEDLIKKLLEAGVHFGHQTKRWCPKMKKYIFGQRSGIYIIDLEKTAQCLNTARDFARDVAAKGGRFLFVGTKNKRKALWKKKPSGPKCTMSVIVGLGVIDEFPDGKKVH